MPARIPRQPIRWKRRENHRLRPRPREWLTTLPCIACGARSEIQCAHVSLSGDAGTAIKASDRYCLPLCGRCHRQQHQIGEPAFWGALGIDPLDYCLRLWTVTGDDAQGARTISRARQAVALHRGEFEYAG